MAKLLDQIIVIDIEATCWEGTVPPNQVSDIIEIGLCLFDVATGLPAERFGTFVQPTRSTVSDFCTQLTTITPEQAANGVSFAEACRTLRTKFDSRERAWASFGDYDRSQFERQCKEFNIHYPFGPTHLNIKSLFALKHRLPREVGMARALELTGLQLEGTHHRGIDDAYNIARLLTHLLEPSSNLKDTSILE